MAVYIDLAVACGSLQEATTINDYFKALPFIHNDIDGYVPWEDENHIWWISIIPRGIGMGVPYDSADDAARFSDRKPEIMRTIYEHLRNCSGYKLAMMGWEASDFVIDKSDGTHLSFDGVQIPEYFFTTQGLIVSEKIYQLIEHKTGFEHFSPGYYWIARTDSWKEFEKA